MDTLGILVAILISFRLCNGEISDDVKEMASKWAPLVWIHPEDPFYPSNIDFYLESMEMRDQEENVVQENPTPSTILTGEATRDYHLNTYTDLECVKCTRPHFFGQPLNQVTLNAFVKEWGDECNTTDVVYPFFYPYNYGKDVCIGADPGGLCLGAKPVFGNHVSDWEHASIRFQNGKPVKMKLACHGFSSRYAFDQAANEFKFEYGEDMDFAGGSFPIEYPETIQLVENSHPEVFSANGSHGTWAAPGKHNFLTFFIHLDDYCERGDAWKTWENMVFLDANMADSDFSGEFSWVDFQGRWGNTKKKMCEVESIVGECGITPGVFGPGTSWGSGGLGDIPDCN